MCPSKARRVCGIPVRVLEETIGALVEHVVCYYVVCVPVPSGTVGLCHILFRKNKKIGYRVGYAPRDSSLDKLVADKNLGLLKFANNQSHSAPATPLAAGRQRPSAELAARSQGVLESRHERCVQPHVFMPGADASKPLGAPQWTIVH